jgi:hypothetical protein
MLDENITKIIFNYLNNENLTKIEKNDYLLNKIDNIIYNLKEDILDSINDDTNHIEIYDDEIYIILQKKSSLWNDEITDILINNYYKNIEKYFKNISKKLLTTKKNNECIDYKYINEELKKEIYYEWNPPKIINYDRDLIIIHLIF